MAEGGVGQNVVEKINCSICLESFKNPKLLPCYHSFCLICLDTYVGEKSRANKFSCPLCRTEIEIPQGGVEKFQSNFYIVASTETSEDDVPCDICGPKSAATHKCTDCDENFCSGCSEAHLKMKMARHHKLVEISTFDSKTKRKLVTRVVCPEHPNEELKFVCKQCGDKLLCIDCKLTEHESHNTKHATNEAKILREDLLDILYGKLIDGQISELQDQNSAKTETLNNTFENDLQNIKNCAQRMHEVVDDVVSTTMQNATKFYTMQLEKAKAEKGELEQRHQSCVSFRENVRLLLDHESDMNILRRGNELRRTVETLKQMSKSDCHFGYVLGFNPGKIESEIVQKCFGGFTGEVRPKTDRPPLESKESLKLLSSFRIPVSGQVTGIAPSKDNKAWVSCWDHNNLYLVDTRGKIERTVDIGGGCDYVITNGDSDCVVSCMQRKCICHVTSTGHVTTVVENLDMYPHGLAYEKGLDQKEELIYTCTNKTLFAGENGYTKKQAAKANGILASDVKVPIRIAVDSVSGRMCLVDFKNDSIFMYDRKDEFLWRYSKDNIEPCGVVFYEANSLDLIVCNCYKDIRLISHDGSCTTILLENKNCRSVVVDDENRLWVGLVAGDIEVYQIQ